MSRTPLGSPVVPLVKMTKRSSPAVVAPQKCSGARGAAAARARAASTARIGRMAAENSAGVVSSTSASVAACLVGLYMPGLPNPHVDHAFVANATAALAALQRAVSQMSQR